MQILALKDKHKLNVAKLVFSGTNLKFTTEGKIYLKFTSLRRKGQNLKNLKNLK